MINKIIYFFLFIFISNCIHAQEVQNNGKNSFIVVMPDGSYETYNSKNKEHQKAMKLFKEKEAQQKKMAKQQAEAIKKAQKQQESALKKEKALSAKKEDKVKKEQPIKEKENKKSEKTVAKNDKKDVKNKDTTNIKPKAKVASAPKKEQKTANAKSNKEKVAVANATVIKNAEINEKPTNFKKLAPENDVMLYPPTPPCASIVETIDDFTKKKRRESLPVLLFQYTDEVMKKYYEGEDFITCWASLSSLETGYKYINLDFKLASDNVSSSYGWLEKDNHLIIKFLDGTTLTLFNSKTDRGTVDNVNRVTSYRGIFPIGSGEEKLLLKGEVDAIRLAWSTGTEDYEIYDIDFFTNLLKCFK